ncbi:AraC family transcriptional regulator [Paenibacillus cymbidii]|uniref:AraC family transcriptional regulator n=1 Tax=Paenibacillus cymbidii TaxID=1639034 RepID=UPI0010801053|nr:AraC family transcriptional regulator [Paenibacillus cymbidii]
MKTFLKNVRDLGERSVAINLTPGPAAKSLPYQLQAVGHFYAKANYFTERKYLDSFQVIHTLYGQGHLHYRNRDYDVMPGDLIFIDCNELHIYDVGRYGHWEKLWAHFIGPGCRTYFEAAMRQGGPVMKAAPDSVVPASLRQLLQLAAEPGRLSELRCQKLIVDIMTELATAGATEDWNAPIASEAVRRVVARIEGDYDKPLTLDELAREMSASKYHMIREFKKHTGQTPHDYLLTLRLSAAKNLLKYADLSVHEVAGQVGFDNPSHFITSFKKQEGVTPLAYRKRWSSP